MTDDDVDSFGEFKSRIRDEIKRAFGDTPISVERNLDVLVVHVPFDVAPPALQTYAFETATGKILDRFAEPTYCRQTVPEEEGGVLDMRLGIYYESDDAFRKRILSHEAKRKCQDARQALERALVDDPDALDQALADDHDELEDAEDLDALIEIVDSLCHALNKSTVLETSIKRTIEGIADRAKHLYRQRMGDHG